VTVGAGCRINRCIVEKGVDIPPGTIVDFDAMSDTEGCVISEKGILVIPKGYSNWSQHSVQQSNTLENTIEFPSKAG